MVENDFLLYVNMHYNTILTTSKQFGEYVGFKNRYHELTSKKPLNKDECEIFLCNFFKKVLEDGINHFLSEISKNTKLKCSVQKEIDSLEDMKQSLLLNNLELLDLYKLRVKANKNLESIRNQQKLIQLTTKQKWVERGIGILIGLIVSFIAYKLGFIG